MKRIVSILVVVLLLTAAVPAVSFAEAVVNSGLSSAAVYRTTASSLNLRSSASAKSGKNIKTSLARGTAVAVTGSCGNWRRVTVLKSGRVGWVDRKYLARGAYARVTTRYQGLNVRSGPGTGYAIRGSIPRNSRNVLVGYISHGWACVRWGKLEGWVCLQGNYKYRLMTWNV